MDVEGTRPTSLGSTCAVAHGCTDPSGPRWDRNTGGENSTRGRSVLSGMWATLRLVGAVVISAALLVLALPPADHGWIAWFCLVPVYAAVRGCGFVRGFASSLATCLLAACITLNGIFYSGPHLAGLPTWHYLSFFLFGFPASMVGALLGDSHERNGCACVTVAAWAVLAEAALQVILPANIALTQYRSATMLSLASVTGIWGVSYLLWLVNAGLAVALSARRYAWLLVVPAAVSTAGIQCSAPAAGARGAVKVAALQPAPEQSVDVTRTAKDREMPAGQARPKQSDLQRLEEALWPMAGETATAEGSGIKLVVWPELSGLAGAAGGDTSSLKRLSALIPGAAFVTTFEDEATPRPHNAASLFEAGRESARYFKRRLFGGERVIHASGDAPVSVPWRGTQVGMSICFDSCYPSIMRELARLPGVQLVVLPCGGPETPFGVVEALHGAFTPFRSAEMGVPIVRSDVSGFPR